MTPEEIAQADFDRHIRHRVALERFGASETRNMLRFLIVVEKDLVAELARMKAAFDGSVTQRRRIASQERLLTEMRRLYAEGYARLRDSFVVDMEELAKLEAEFQTDSLKRSLEDLRAVAAGSVAEAAGGAIAVQTPTAEAVKAVIESKPMQGKFVADWLDDLERGAADRIERALRISFVEGESLTNAIDRVQGVFEINRRGAEALVRTATTHIAAAVAEETYQANPELIEGVEWVSILDSRTTPICRSRDGQVYPAGEGPRPPAHVRCRSTVAPVIVGLPKLDRPTYGTWLAKQPAGVQDDILGPTRGKLFRDGDLPIDRFTSPDGRPLTLEDLRDRNAAAFKRAGL